MFANLSIAKNSYPQNCRYLWFNVVQYCGENIKKSVTFKNVL